MAHSTLLAVLEHIPPEEHDRLGEVCAGLLNPCGRVIVTVPSPRVDRILDVLQKVGVVDAETLDEHYGFDPRRTEQVFRAPHRERVCRPRFQLGLNLYVFQRL